MRNLIKLTDEQIEAQFNNCCTVTDLTFTTDTLADFLKARESYLQPGRIVKETAETLEIDRVQSGRGQPRRDSGDQSGRGL